MSKKSEFAKHLVLERSMFETARVAREAHDAALFAEVAFRQSTINHALIRAPKVNDWITGFLAMTEGLPTPPIYRLWSAISSVASALERRTFMRANMKLAYPNLFTVLIGPPSVGKTVALDPAKQLLRASKAVIMAPDDMTKAALVDTLAESHRKIARGGDLPPLEYSPLCVMVSEFGTLVNAHDLEFFSTLNDLFDNKSEHKSRRRGHNSGKTISIVAPQLNILAATQPGFLSDLLPESAWHMGFTARLFLIYSDGGPKVDIFAEMRDNTFLEDELVKGLVSISKCVGEWRPSEGAKRAFRKWISNGMPPVPDHPRLAHYTGRRDLYMCKLSMIAAASRNEGDMLITEQDFERALSWLLGAEQLMPDVFRDMHLKSDGVVMGECHRFVSDLWIKSGKSIETRKPIHRTEIMNFLAMRGPADKALRVLECMTAAGWLAQMPDSLLFVPRARGFRSEE